VSNSRAAARLRELMDGPSLVDAGGGVRVWLDRKYARYLAHDAEFWARAYAQYIGTRSGNAALLAELSAMRQGVYPLVWDDDDFEPIAAAIDGLLREKGWLP
jgi:hypothetical protein